MWEYLAIDYIKGSVGINEDDDLQCSISGVLSHAVYEDVMLTFRVLRYPNMGEERIEYEVRVWLNAAGEAAFRIDNRGFAYILNGKGMCDYGMLVKFDSHSRDIQLKAVEGKVNYGP